MSSRIISARALVNGSPFFFKFFFSYQPRRSECLQNVLSSTKIHSFLLPISSSSFTSYPSFFLPSALLLPQRSPIAAASGFLVFPHTVVIRAERLFLLQFFLFILLLYNIRSRLYIIYYILVYIIINDRKIPPLFEFFCTSFLRCSRILYKYANVFETGNNFHLSYFK